MILAIYIIFKNTPSHKYDCVFKYQTKLRNHILGQQHYQASQQNYILTTTYAYNSVMPSTMILFVL